MLFGIIETKKKPKEWPANREYVQTVLGGGGRYDIYIPAFEDIEELEALHGFAVDAAIQIAAASINYSIEEFMKIPMQDGHCIMEIILNKLSELKPLVISEKP